MRKVFTLTVLILTCFFTASSQGNLPGCDTTDLFGVHQNGPFIDRIGASGWVTPFSTVAGPGSAAVALDPVSKKFFYVSYNTISGAHQVFVYNPNSQQLSLSPNFLPPPPNGSKYVRAAIHPITGLMWISDGSGHVFTLNPSDTLTSSLLYRGVMQFLDGDINDALSNGDWAFDQQGQLWSVGQGNSVIPNMQVRAFLMRVDTVSLQIEKVAQLSNSLRVNGIAFGADGTIYSTNSEGQFNTINPANGQVTLISTYQPAFADLTSCSTPNLNPYLTLRQTVEVVSCNNNIMKVEYTITTNNNGNVAAGSSRLTASLPAGVSYVPGTTRLNGLTVADNNGNSPYIVGLSSVPNNAMVNSPGQPAGSITTGTSNNAVVKFQASLAQNGFYSTVPAVLNYTSPGNQNAQSNILGGIADINNCRFEVSVLPAKLAWVNGFMKNCRQAGIEWKSLEENNVATYQVEKSIDGRNYQTLGQTAALATGTHTYQFPADQPEALAWYRLKIVDRDGRFEYSGTLLIRNSCASGEKEKLRIYPNPTAGDTRIEVEGREPNEPMRVEIISAQGIILISQQFRLNKGFNNLNLGLKKLEPGSYTVRIIRTSSGEITVSKLLKH